MIVATPVPCVRVSTTTIVDVPPVAALFAAACVLRKRAVSNVKPPPPPLVPAAVRVLVYTAYALDTSGTYGPLFVLRARDRCALTPVGVGTNSVSVTPRDVRPDCRLLTSEATEATLRVRVSVKASAVAMNWSR